MTKDATSGLYPVDTHVPYTILQNEAGRLFRVSCVIGSSASVFPNSEQTHGSSAELCQCLLMDLHTQKSHLCAPIFDAKSVMHYKGVCFVYLAHMTGQTFDTRYFWAQSREMCWTGTPDMHPRADALAEGAMGFYFPE